jgi:hydroxymethylpyrimidine pyrophosphatase-like HAD family hydrolase
VDAATLRALERFRASGRSLVLITGRQISHLLPVCPRIELFDRVVAENGGVLYDPGRRHERLLTSKPSPALVAALESRGVAPLSVGRAVIATYEPHAPLVSAVLCELGLSHGVVLNKGALMILPSGVDKATGLGAALADLGVPPSEVIGVGDAENDLAFMARCGWSVAVANALPSVKAQADFVTNGEAGAGVVELIDRLLETPADR